MFKVEASGFNPSLEICRLDDWKGDGKISEKRKVGSIGVQYYHTRKRMKDELLYSPDVSVFEKCNSSSSVTEGGYADDILCGLNIEDTIDDIPNSPLLDSYENVEEDPLCTADATTMLVATPSIQCREEVKRSLFHDDHPDVCQWEADNALKSLSHLDFVQLNEGKVICILNTEDSEIPCNDDIFMEIHPFPSFRPQIATDSTDPLASCANEKVSQQGPSEEKDPTLSFTPSQMDGPELSSDLDSAHPQGVDTSTTYSEMSLRTEVGSLKMIDPESMANNPSLSHKNSDGDGDLPNFCDIEAMILQLDLEYAQGSCIISEVTRHQYNYSDRTIIRLDNIACSSLIRSMSSLSAFATFYSRHFHYYIKKTEISGMNFLLEINDKYVQWYLNHIIKKSQAEASARMVNVKPLTFDASSTISKLDDSKGNKKTREKRKGRCIHVQYYRKSKRIKDNLFYSPDLHFLEKSKKILDHVTLDNEAQFSDVMFSDSLANKFRFGETDFVDKVDSANSSTVTEGDIICSLIAEDTMDDIPDSQLLDSQENVLEDSSCNADAATLFVATRRIKCQSQSKNPSFYGDQQGVRLWEADVEDISKSHLDSIQLSEGKFNCILNTEDSEIPQNDDIFLLTRPSPSATPQITIDTIDQLFSADGKDGEQELSAGNYLAPSVTDIIDQLSLKLAVEWKKSVDTSASYSEISLWTEAGSLNNSISNHNNCYRNSDPPFLSDIETLTHRMDIEYAEESYITSEVEMHQNIARVVKVEPSGFNPLSATSRLDDLKQNKKTREKRKVGSIHIQHYPKRKEGEYAYHPGTIRSFATTDVVDRLTNDQTGYFDPSFELKDDSANSSTVTEGDILCSLNTEETMYDIPDSQLLNPPENVLEDSLCNADATTLLVATPRMDCDEESKDSEITRLDSVQLSDEKVICNLNTEDSEIPHNDDSFMQSRHSSVRPQTASDSINPFFSADLYYELDSAQPHIAYSFRSDSFDTKCLNPLFGQPDKITNPVLIEDRVLSRYGLDALAMYSDMSLRTEVESLKIIYPESVDNYLSISDHNDSDSDDDLSCFSDIEALIHRIDMEYAEESYISSEVGRHRYNYYKGTITRLEQTSISSWQRAMSSLGALAVFYDPQFNYYIKKTEVTIGRSTKDADVDIDLQKVGHAKMISRRQATITMETNGSFTLKNLGKSSITMNGNPVAHGQAAALSSSCVIEISGMKFMFEINESHVRRYLDHIIKESQCMSRTFEWSPED